MKKWLLLTSALMLSPASAQHHSHAHHPQGGDAPTGAAHAHAPYAGMHEREIKALSTQQIDDLRAGRGMSMALPAELNGYPGPLHALELSGQLGLSDTQVAAIRRNLEEMQKTARLLGEQLITAEAKLDSLFRERTASRENLEASTLEAATAKARLRAHHLGHHLDMMDILNREQVEVYNTLRGYE